MAREVQLGPVLVQSSAVVLSVYCWCLWLFRASGTSGGEVVKFCKRSCNCCYEHSIIEPVPADRVVSTNPERASTVGPFAVAESTSGGREFCIEDHLFSSAAGNEVFGANFGLKFQRISAGELDWLEGLGLLFARWSGR